MRGRPVLLLALLGDDEMPRDHEARRGEEGETQGEREPEKLRRPRDCVDGVDDREGGAADRRGEEERDSRGLRATVGEARLDDPLSSAEQRTPSPTPEQQHDRGHEPTLHDCSRLPITRHVATSAAMPMNHVTRPSGTGPTCPIAQPPRSSGCFV